MDSAANTLADMSLLGIAGKQDTLGKSLSDLLSFPDQATDEEKLAIIAHYLFNLQIALASQIFFNITEELQEHAGDINYATAHILSSQADPQKLAYVTGNLEATVSFLNHALDQSVSRAHCQHIAKNPAMMEILDRIEHGQEFSLGQLPRLEKRELIFLCEIGAIGVIRIKPPRRRIVTRIMRGPDTVAILAVIRRDQLAKQVN